MRNHSERRTDLDSLVIKVTQQCDFGWLDLRSQLITSYAGSVSAVPFYLQPTVGGSDIQSRASLRGFRNYRFRDAVFVQADYTVQSTTRSASFSSTTQAPSDKPSLHFPSATSARTPV